MNESKFEWHFIYDNTEFGPVTIDFLKTVPLTPETQVRLTETNNWKPIRDTELYPILFNTTLPDTPQIRIPFSNLLKNRKQNSIPDTQPANYFVRHWRGDLPTEFTFIFNLMILLLAEIYLSEYLPLSKHNLTQKAAVQSLCFISILVLFGWQIVGCFRCLRQQYKTNKLSAPNALTYSVILIMGIYIQVNYEIPLKYMALERTIFEIQDDNELPPLVLNLAKSGAELQIHGGINRGSAEWVISVLKNTPTVKTIRIHTPGGYANEAQQIGRFIRERNLSTCVSEECASAGTEIFVAGTTRTLERKDQLKFHAGQTTDFGVKNPDAIRQTVNDLSVKYMLEMGIDEDFIHQILQTPNTSLWIPTVKTLLKAKVITSFVSEKAVPPTDTTNPSIDDPVSYPPLTIQDFPELAILTENNEDLLEDVQIFLQNANAKNLSKDIAKREMKSLINNYTLDAIPFAADSTLVALLEFNTNILNKYRQSDLSLLSEILFNPSNPSTQTSELAKAIKLQKTEILASLIRSSKNRIQLPIDRITAKQDLNVILAKMAKISPTQTANFEKIQKGAHYTMTSNEIISAWDLFSKQLADMSESRKANFYRNQMVPPSQ